jgi:hypothetical protein
MVLCSRFKPALLITFLYACLAPLTILLRMRGAAFYWIGNETAFCFFMLFVFPFAVAVFSCAFQVQLFAEAVRTRSQRIMPIAAFVIALCLLSVGVKDDMWPPPTTVNQVQRLRQPYMVRDAKLMWQLHSIHRSAFATNDLDNGKRQYVSLLRQNLAANSADPSLSMPMVAAFELFNFINVGFGVLVLCYIIFLAIPVAPSPGQPVSDKIDERVTNHLIFVVTALFLWIPCRIYADWHMNFATFDWWSSYTALLTIVIGLVACCFVLGFNMASGSLYKRFVVPAAAMATVCGIVFAWKPGVIAIVAQKFSLWPTAFKISAGFIFCFVLWYVADTVHQVVVQPAPPSPAKP